MTGLIKEVHIPTNPDFDGQEIADDDIQPAVLSFLEMILLISSEDKNASVFWDVFQKQYGKS